MLRLKAARRVHSCGGVRSCTLLSVLQIVLSAAGLAVLTLLAPRLGDDWFYALAGGDGFREFFSCGGMPVSTMADAWHSVARHALDINGRFADKLLIFTALIPLSMSRLICAALWGVGLWQIARLALGREMLRAPLAMGLLMTAVWWLAPWEDAVISLSCEFNYLMSTALGLLILTEVLERDKPSLWLAPIALLAGGMHESVSAGVGLGLVVMWVLCRCRWSLQRWLIGGCFAAGMAVMLALPGTGARLDSATGGGFSLIWIAKTLLLMPAFWLLAAALIVSLIKRPKLPWRRLMTISAAALGALLPALYTMMRGRALWMTSICMIIIAFIMLTAAYPTLLRPHRHAALLTAGILCCWLALCCMEQNRLTAAQKQLELVAEHGNGSPLLWGDTPDYYDTSPFTFGVTQAPVGDYFLNIRAIGLYYHNRGYFEHETVVLPIGLRGTNYRDWPKIESNFGYIYGSFPIYYAPGMKVEPATLTYTLDLTDAPLLTPAGVLARLGKTRARFTTSTPQVLSIPLAELPDDARSLFACQGIVPDTLRFIYIERLPRYLLPGRVVSVEQPACAEI